MEEKKSIVARNIIMGILLVAIGVLGIIFAGAIFGALSNIITWVVAVVLGIAAIVNIIIFVRDRKNWVQLVIGILAIATAVILIFMPNLMVWIISVFLGLFLLVDGGYKIKEAFAANKAKAKQWYVSLIAGIVGIILGILAIAYPIRFGTEIGKLFVILVSIFLLVNGILNIVHGVFVSKA